VVLHEAGKLNKCPADLGVGGGVHAGRGAREKDGRQVVLLPKSAIAPFWSLMYTMALTCNAWCLDSLVLVVLQILRVVGANVHADREALHGVHARSSSVQRDLPFTDAHAVASKVTCTAAAAALTIAN
jgi:hypothetical protein